MLPTVVYVCSALFLKLSCIVILLTCSLWSKRDWNQVWRYTYIETGLNTESAITVKDESCKQEVHLYKNVNEEQVEQSSCLGFKREMLKHATHAAVSKWVDRQIFSFLAQQ